MRRLLTFLFSALLSFSLTACSNNSEVTSNPVSQTRELRVMKLTDEYIIEDSEILDAFNELFEKMWKITETSEEVVFLGDTPYEIEGDIILQDADKQLSYCFFESHSDSYLSDVKNVIYIVLSKDNNSKGYFVLEGTELHHEIEQLIKCI
ncbi:MAG: hypothetical protein KBT48_08550 [Firmicutes bacterium]|nr:hypothetical protein [Bacillota bacterium]